MIGKMTGSKELMEMGNSQEVDNMCTALEKLKRQGIEQRKAAIIRNLLENGLSEEVVKRIAKVTEEEIIQAKMRQ